MPPSVSPHSQGLIDKLDHDLHYALVHEGKMRVEDITNYEDVKASIAQQLEALRDIPNRRGGEGRSGISPAGEGGTYPSRLGRLPFPCGK